MGRSNKHPNDSDRHACVAVADLAATWCGTPQLTVAVSVLRGFVAGGRTKKDVETAMREIVGVSGFGPYGFLPDDRRADPVANVLKNTRDAFLVAYNLCIDVPSESLSAKEWAKHERVLLAHVENAGRLAGLADAVDLTRSAWEGAASSAIVVRGSLPSPHSSEHARLILRGQMVELLRKRRKLSPEELVVAIKAAGGEFSVAQLKRVENGTAAPATARSNDLARSLGVEMAWADDVETQASAFAEKFAGMAVGAHGDRWFSDVTARDGEEVARAITLLSVVSALRKS